MMSSPVWDIETLIGSIREGRVRITDHAVEEAWNDDLSFDEIFFSIFDGRIIEEYLDDRPYPSSLVSGRSFKGKTIHSVWAYNRSNRYSVLITVYRPDSSLWNGDRRRKMK